MKDKLKKYLDLYLNNNYVGMAASSSMESFSMNSFGMKRCAKEEVCEDSDISSFIEQNKEEDTFQSKLLKMIDERNLKDSDVYNKVNIDRRLFSKIRSNKDYHPNKETIILFGIALELSENEMLDLVGENEVHIVTGGFPCQGFSVAGFRDPDDERNVLYKEVLQSL